MPGAINTSIPRKEILEAAIKHTVGDRDVQYGKPYDNLTNTAILITAYLEAKSHGRPIGPETDKRFGQYPLTAEDVAHILALVKIARTFTGAVKRDTYEDAAAYIAIAGECAEIEQS